MDFENTESMENTGNYDGIEEAADIGEAAQEELERIERRKQRMARMRRRKRRQELARRMAIPCAIAVTVLLIAAGFGIRGIVRGFRAGQAAKQAEINENEINETETKKSDTEGINKAGIKAVNVAGCQIGGEITRAFVANLAEIKELAHRTVGGKSGEPPLKASADGKTASLAGEVVSKNGILIDVAERKILGQRDAMARISPASMTKILTVLVAAEHTTNLDDTFEITREITDYSFVNDCSNAGFEVGEKVTIRDLFYGTIMPSGADAALGLAIYTAGSHEEFVKLMNEKIDELGLSETSHFTNCVGLYDENHYSTVYDMGVMLKAAYDNTFCREVLSQHVYTMTGADRHPDGITLSNLFLRRIEDLDTKGEARCAKTGYVMQSGNCAASLSVGNDGKVYICVTAHSTSPWQCVRDHAAIYRQFLP